MKKNKINYGLIVFLLIIVLLFIPIIIDYVKTRNIEIISVSDISSKMNTSESFLVYVGELDNTTKRELRKMREKTTNDYSYDYGVYNVKSDESLNDIFGDNVKLALIVEGDIQKVYSKYEQSTVDKDVEVYLVNDINDDNRSYKVFDNFDDYKKTVKKNKTTMIVFGYSGCTYCNRFKPVYNAVANKYNLDIYYFDSDNYDSKEYSKVVNYDLKVPAKCGSSGEDFKLSDGFGTPLTIFTKKGKIVDCIGGYVNRDKLIGQLKTLDMISE